MLFFSTYKFIFTVCTDLCRFAKSLKMIWFSRQSCEDDINPGILSMIHGRSVRMRPMYVTESAIDVPLIHDEMEGQHMYLVS